MAQTLVGVLAEPVEVGLVAAATEHQGRRVRLIAVEVGVEALAHQPLVAMVGRELWLSAM